MVFDISGNSYLICFLFCFVMNYQFRFLYQPIKTVQENLQEKIRVTDSKVKTIEVITNGQTGIDMTVMRVGKQEFFCMGVF